MEKCFESIINIFKTLLVEIFFHLKIYKLMLFNAIIQPIRDVYLILIALICIGIEYFIAILLKNSTSNIILILGLGYLLFFIIPIMLSKFLAIQYREKKYISLILNAFTYVSVASVIMTILAIFITSIFGLTDIVVCLVGLSIAIPFITICGDMLLVSLFDNKSKSAIESM